MCYFISYSSEDRNFVHKLYKSLRARDIDLWLDIEEIHSGDSWPKAIQSGLDECQAMILVISPDSMESEQVEREWMHYLNVEKRPIHLVRYRPSKINYQISTIQYVDFHEQKYEDSLKKLLKEIGVEIDKPTSVPKQTKKEKEAGISINPPLGLGLLFISSVIVLFIFQQLGFISFPSALPTATEEIVVAVADTNTPTTALTNTISPTETDTPTATDTPTRDAVEMAIERAQDFFGTNTDWEVFLHTFKDNIEMVLVPVGCFEMGTNGIDEDESPAHLQCIEEPYWLDRTEVSYEHYMLCAEVGSCTSPIDPQEVMMANTPVRYVNWFQAREYCVWRGDNYDLPTEVQWEFAARGVDSWTYPWGNDMFPSYATYSINSETIPSQVGSRPMGSSWVGAYDMSGNVWEWTSSRYLTYPYSESLSEDSTVITSRRVARGGSFQDPEIYMRPSYRYGYLPDASFNGVGFRCVQNITNISSTESTALLALIRADANIRSEPSTTAEVAYINRGVNTYVIAGYSFDSDDRIWYYILINQDQMGWIAGYIESVGVRYSSGNVAYMDDVIEQFPYLNSDGTPRQ